MPLQPGPPLVQRICNNRTQTNEQANKQERTTDAFPYRKLYSSYRLDNDAHLPQEAHQQCAPETKKYTSFMKTYLVHKYPPRNTRSRSESPTQHAHLSFDETLDLTAVVCIIDLLTNIDFLSGLHYIHFPDYLLTFSPLRTAERARMPETALLSASHMFFFIFFLQN